MNRLKINGTTEFMGIHLPIIEGGFGEDKRAMLVKDISTIHNQPLGEINRRINDNRQRFKDSIDIIDIRANGFEPLGSVMEFTKQSFNQSKNIYILSERGYSKLVKIMDDDKSWEVHDELIDHYFKLREQVWLDIGGFEGYYQVSNYGNVRSINRVITDTRGIKYKRKGVNLKLRRDKDGYLVVNLKKESKNYSFKVHRLVAEAFIENPNLLPEVNHKDEIKSNNYVDNLEWCDRKYNNNYGTMRERIRISQGIKIYGVNIENGKKIYFDSMSEVERYGFNKHCVRDCVRGRNRVKSHKGYKWFERCVD